MNYVTGILAAFGTLMCWTFGTLAFTRASKNAQPLIVNRVRLLFACVILTGISLLLNFTTWIELLNNYQQWFWLALSGIVGLTIGDYFAFSAFRDIGGSKASLFNTFAPAAALLLGMVLLNEHLNGIGIIGMSISFSGITWFVWANGKNKSGSHQHETRGIVFAILGGLCQGIGLVLAKKGMNLADIHPIHATWMRMLAATLATYGIGVFRTHLLRELSDILNNKAALYPMLAGTLFGPVCGVSLSLLAAQNLEVSLAQTIFSLLPLSVITVAALMGHEKINRISLIAALISILGVVILVWRNEIG